MKQNTTHTPSQRRSGLSQVSLSALQLVTLTLLAYASIVYAQEENPTPTTPSPAPAPVQAAPAPVQAAPAQAAPTQGETLPDTGVEALASGAQRDLIALMKEGPCPCNPEVTMFQCIQERSCPGATDLARYGVDLYKQGLGSDQVAELVIKRFIAEFTPPIEFKLDQTPWKGAQDAPITIVEFADFECPHCAIMSFMLKDILTERPNIKIYFKQFPLPFHKVAPLASQATIAAHKQGMFWEMHDLIFKNQQDLSPEKIMAFAEQLNLNMMIFRSDLMSDEVKAQVQAERDEGVRAGLQGTPTLFFNGKVYTGKAEKSAIIAHIDELLAKIKRATP